jgi:hypothetical protein
MRLQAPRRQRGKGNMMPIYLVRWPDLSASLVRASSEEELLVILDQVANPDGCEWSVYEGPLFINFRLPVEWSVRDAPIEEPVAPEQVVIDDVSRMATEPVVETMEVSLAGGDAGFDTGNEVVRLAFPEIHAAVEDLYEGDEALEREGVLPEADLRKALHRELARFLRSSWRRAQLEKKDDPISYVAREMDLPVTLARKFAEIASKQKTGDGDEPGPSEE